MVPRLSWDKKIIIIKIVLSKIFHQRLTPKPHALKNAKTKWWKVSKIIIERKPLTRQSIICLRMAKPLTRQSIICLENGFVFQGLLAPDFSGVISKKNLNATTGEVSGGQPLLTVTAWTLPPKKSKVQFFAVKYCAAEKRQIAEEMGGKEENRGGNGRKHGKCVYLVVESSLLGNAVRLRRPSARLTLYKAAWARTRGLAVICGGKGSECQRAEGAVASVRSAHQPKFQLVFRRK